MSSAQWGPLRAFAYSITPIMGIAPDPTTLRLLFPTELRDEGGALGIPPQIKYLNHNGDSHARPGNDLAISRTLVYRTLSVPRLRPGNLVADGVCIVRKRVRHSGVQLSVAVTLNQLRPVGGGRPADWGADGRASAHVVTGLEWGHERTDRSPRAASMPIRIKVAHRGLRSVFSCPLPK